MANAGLIKKVYLPREVFPLSTVGSAIVNFGIQFCVLLARHRRRRQHPVVPPPRSTCPLAIVLILVFATALAILLSAINVYLRDVQHLIEIVILILFWASPIVYSFAFVNRLPQGRAGWRSSTSPTP